jgi:hypothetical protein
MRISAFAESHARPPDDLNYEPIDLREEQIEDMFPDSYLPSFAPIPSRQRRFPDAQGFSRKRERESHDH